jgi:uncharacterized protein (DUF885 family)
MTDRAAPTPASRPATTADRAALAALADEAWDTAIAASPLYATMLGDHRFDDRLPPIEPGEQAAVLLSLSDRLETARSLADRAWDDPADTVTAEALVDFLAIEVGLREAATDRWTADPLDGPQIGLVAIPSFQAVETPEQGRALAARYAAMGPWMDRHTANVRAGLADGRVSPVSPVRKVVDQLDDLLGRPDAAWPLLEPLAIDRPGWSEAERARFADELTGSLRDGIRPAFARYRALLVDEVLPAARSDERPGLMHVPGGDRAYGLLTRAHTSLEVDPAEVHRLGLAEVARIDTELEALAGRVLGTSDRAAAIKRLRTDPALYFSTADEVADVARRSLARAVEAIPAAFGRLPKAPCDVVEVPSHEAEHTTIAYYRSPAADGSRPGQYYINTLRPETRPRYEAEALAFHESVPGHHLQIAIAQEVEGLPAFRRFGGTNAYIEGWGLYTERLSDEMGLYSGDLDRIGILSFDGWRACRLVVDTGLHALGWSRARAIDFMVEHTALAPSNIANEVDRYITMPGQALAYKLGQLELLRLRATARERLGPAFDIRGFHDAVLGDGALPLGALGGVIERWIATRSAPAS